MSKNQTQTTETTQKQPNSTGGRPAKNSGKTPTERSIANLQYALDRAAAFIHDGTTSYARRARTAARADVPRATVDAGLAAMQGALDDASAAVEKAYAAPTKAPKPAARITLGE